MLKMAPAEIRERVRCITPTILRNRTIRRDAICRNIKGGWHLQKYKKFGRMIFADVWKILEALC